MQEQIESLLIHIIKTFFSKNLSTLKSSLLSFASPKSALLPLLGPGLQAVDILVDIKSHIVDRSHPLFDFFHSFKLWNLL